MNPTTMLAVFPLGFEQPVWLWLLLLIPALVAISHRSLAGLERGRRVLALGLRSLVIAAIAAALARVSYQKENDNLTVIFLLDRSRSIPHGAEQDLLTAQEKYVHEVVDRAREAGTMNRDDKVGVISFSGDAHLEQLPMRGKIYFDHVPPPTVPDVTNIAQAFRLAMASFPEGTGRRIVLLTDGNENAGDVLREAAIAEANDVTVDVVPMHYQYRNEVFFDRLIVPAQARLREVVPIRMILRADQPGGGTIYLTHNGQPVPLGDTPEELGKRVELVAGVTLEGVKIPLNTTGPHRFEARFVPDHEGMDQIIENNVANGFTIVEGKGLALLLTRDPQDDQPLFDALRREQIDVVMHTLDEVTIDMVGLQQYGTIILANMPASDFTREQQEILASYVRDFGGGLIMTGGDEGFGAGGWIGSPVEAVMPVDFEIKHKKVIPRGALAIVMHTCELPRANFWGEEVAVTSLKTISSRDYFGCVAYSGLGGGVSWEVPMAIAADKAGIARKIQKMQIGDMPDFTPAIQMAITGLIGAKGAAQRHMIVVSDGDPNQTGLPALIKQMVAAKITCSTVGIGYGVHVQEAGMRQLAGGTGGRFYAVRNPRRLPQILTKEAKVVRKPLISEEPFTPQSLAVGSQITLGLPVGSLPTLGGLVLTQRKNDPQVEMPLVRPSADGPDPLLAHWQHELGRSVVFTSGLWTRWGAGWVGWEHYGKLWAQMVRWSMRQNKASEFQVFTRLEDDNTGRVVIEALNKDASYLNMLRLQFGRVIGPDNRAAPLELTQTGPGRYEAVFEARQRGQYLVSMSVSEPGDPQPAFISTGLSIPFSPEYRQLETNLALLNRIIDPEKDWREFEMDASTSSEVFRRPAIPTVATQPVWFEVVAWVLLPLFLLDVAGRRLASVVALSLFVELLIVVVLLFGVGVIDSGFLGVLGVVVLAELVGWTIRFRSIEPSLRWLTHTVTVLAPAGQRAAASLSQLRATRDKVRDGVTSAGDPNAPAPPPPPAVPAAPAPDRSGRFDVGDEQAAEPAAGDLSEALGGADAGPGSGQQPSRRRPADTQDDEPAEDMTSRLLRARQRARENREDKGNDETS